MNNGTPQPPPAPAFEESLGNDLTESAAQAVPEPGSIALLLGTLATALGCHRRRVCWAFSPPRGGAEK